MRTSPTAVPVPNSQFFLIKTFEEVNYLEDFSKLKIYNSIQCFGSGFVGSVSFLASKFVSVSQRYGSRSGSGSGSGSFHHQAKIVRKTFIYTVL
jgi:hypothetical protein